MAGSARLILKTEKTNTDGKHPLYLRVIINRKTKYFSLGSKFACKEEQWNDEEQIFRKNYENYKHANRTLSEKKNKADKILYNLDSREGGSTIFDFEREFIKKANTLGVIEYFDTVIEEFKKQGNFGNRRIYKDTRNNIESFLKQAKEIKTADYSLENIDVAFLTDYESYLRNKHKMYKDESKCENSTIFIRMRTLRALINKAIQRKLITNYPFKEFKISRLKTQTKKRALDEIDLKKLFKLKYKEDDSLFNSLNYFKFMYMKIHLLKCLFFLDLPNQ